MSSVSSLLHTYLEESMNDGRSKLGTELALLSFDQLFTLHQPDELGERSGVPV